MADYFNAASDDGFDDGGRPGISQFANAVQMWSIMQPAAGSGGVTVGEAAKVFNCDIEMIIQAVKYHYWMFLAGDERGDRAALVIEHEGE